MSSKSENFKINIKVDPSYSFLPSGSVWIRGLLTGVQLTSKELALHVSIFGYVLGSMCPVNLPHVRDYSS